MHGTNPYAQAGWYNPQNPHTINNHPWGSSGNGNPGPSIFGALPYANQGQVPTVLTFHYVCLNPDVLNCTITGPTSIPYLEVATVMRNNISTTVFRKSDGRVLASIEWTRAPTVEIAGQTLSKRLVSQWMRSSPDRSQRGMNVNGRDFIWVSMPTGTCVFAHGDTKNALVKLHRGPQVITLELTTEAFNAGLLEASIVATVLIHSGRNFD
ncbi:hypothetical protein CC1G_07101 [Coprinopsis cinerea okayama7|uniref:DUF6593 domain-containing protein n=1 Tax=Coprinopsis cinerea (strain Okayama-7 / 130 / ATCC MYA-4618 / FGSC 9003) TaxID=240176 RepID=A8NUG8_COPC7|nr:hypothetical protein CC1G_07101 [Coprinopsis cinerea okayama7\|eukprot:XP_001836454.1 hypothetical protein CC1G_07101 [Coprinopsis cinerea okayama7\